MNFKKLLFIICFLSSNTFGLEVQFFISPYFYQNPHSYSQNGFQYYSFFPGKLLKKAINKMNSNYSECSDLKNSDIIIYLYPTTFYNPLMTTLYTDLNVRVYENIKNKRNLLIKYQNQVLLNQSADNQFIEHYMSLINKLHLELRNIYGQKKMIKINGSLCKLFQ